MGPSAVSLQPLLLLFPPLTLVQEQTLAGTAGHPVLIDAVSRALATSKAYQIRLTLAESRGEQPPTEDILEWIGPALFTDCVFR